MRNINKTVWELLLGILFSGIILEIVGTMIVKDKLYYSIGLGTGVILAVFMTFSIHSSVVKAVDVGERGAKAKMITSYVFRTVLVVAVIIIVGVTKLGNLVGLLLGIMTLKVAAYIQPVTHKFLTGGKE
ncbi:MAG: hypothetical protein J6B06_05375 [Lachnospiraceae bacterium]|nr:hypothetical protein [Lachnospiraceae bacterium]